MTARALTLTRRPALVMSVAAVGVAMLAAAVVAGAPPPLLLGVFGIVALAAALARPEFVAPTIVFLLFLDVPGVAVKKYGAPPIIAAFMIAALVIPVADVVLRGGRIRLGWPVGLVTGFFLVQFAAALASRESAVALSQLTPFLLEGLLLTVLIINAVRSVVTLERCLWAMLAAGGLLGAVSVFQQVTSTFDRPYGGFALVPKEYLRGLDAQARLSGPLGDPNYYAQILVTVIPIGMVLLRTAPPRRRMLAIAATVAALGGVVLSYSRGAILALGLMVALAAAFRLVKASHVMLVMAVLAVGIAVVPSYRDRVLSIGSGVTGATKSAGSTGAADQAVLGRAGEMAAAALVFEDHPLIGVGPGVFPFYYQQYVQRLGLEAHTKDKVGANKGETPTRVAHNIFLSVAAELGLAGLAVFLALIGTVMFRLGRIRRRLIGTDPRLAWLAAALLLAVAGYLTAGLFLTLAFERYFWTLIALAGAVVAIAATTADGRGETAPAAGTPRAR